MQARANLRRSDVTTSTSASATRWRRDLTKDHGAETTIHTDGKGIPVSVYQFKPKAGDTTEKITINLGVVDLGQIDLLVQEGFYSNRTDLIRTAIRNQLATHAEVVRETVARKTFRPRPAALHAPRSRSGAGGRADAADTGARPRQHCRGCIPRTRPRHDRIGGRARRPACQCGGQGRPGGSNPLTRIASHPETQIMNATLHAGMLEATRLTRAGQLLEATALIQRTLRGEPSPQRLPKPPAPVPANK